MSLRSCVSLGLCLLFSAGTSPPSQDERRHHAVELLGIVRDGAERIQSIVRGLKHFSRPELETREPIDVVPVLEASIAMVAHEIRCRAQLKTTFDRTVPPVLGNTARL